MEKAIRKAQEGGYLGIDMPAPNIFVWSEKRYEKNYENACNSLVLLDPLFWQALGKAEGWEEDKDRNKFWQSHKRGDTVTLLDEWENEMHNFIDFIINHGSPEEFFNQLLH